MGSERDGGFHATEKEGLVVWVAEEEEEACKEKEGGAQGTRVALALAEEEKRTGRERERARWNSPRDRVP